MNLTTKKKRTGVQNILKLIVVVAILAGCILFLVMSFMGIKDCEHYRRVYENAVTVTATVTRHSDYVDSDYDTRYRNHISYTVDGKEYTDIIYSTTGKKSNLLPLGQELQVQISPEDPTVLMKTLKGNSVMLIVGCVFAMLMLTSVQQILRTRKFSTGVYNSVDTETVEKDLKTAVRGRFFRVLWLLMSIGFGLICWRYPMLFATKTLIALGAFVIFWLVCMRRTVLDYRKIQAGEYRILNSRLVRKDITTDSDGDDVYTLYYQSSKGKWSKVVSRDKYLAAEEGSYLLAVYLEGENKPTIHYNEDGKCCSN